MKKYIGMLLLLALVLPACSKDLTRSQAKKILSKKLPNCIEVPLVQEFLTNKDGRDGGPNYFVKKLVEVGYGSLKREIKYIYLLTTPVPDHAIYTFTPDEKLKPFIVEEKIKKNGTKIARVQIGEITVEDVVGISKESETTCEVQYKLRLTSNELAKLLDLKLPTKVSDTPQKAFFKLYDDGWRRDEERERAMLEKAKKELAEKRWGDD
jgi:hypothetical protein